MHLNIVSLFQAMVEFATERKLFLSIFCQNLTIIVCFIWIGYLNAHSFLTLTKDKKIIIIIIIKIKYY